MLVTVKLRIQDAECRGIARAIQATGYLREGPNKPGPLGVELPISSQLLP